MKRWILPIIFILISACSTQKKAEAPPTKVETQAETQSEAQPESAAPAADSPTATEVITPKSEEVAQPPAAPETKTFVAPDKSLQWLKNGNTRYFKQQFRKDGRAAKDRKRLASGQTPHAIVLACSDAHAPPEIVFDQVPGEIFVVRVAGEALDSSVLASLEHAVSTLSPRLIVVMGHTSCSAIKAVIEAKNNDSVDSDFLEKMIDDIRPRLRTVINEKPSPNLEVESALNADGVARDLLKRSELIKKMVEAKELKIVTALFNLKTGKVQFY